MSPLIVRQDHTGEGLYATRNYRCGEVVFEFEHVVWRPERDRHTVEHPFGGHFFHPILAKTAHSCDPNCRISFPHRAMLAVRSIAPGEPISFDYQSTEHRISHPFDCLCGSRRCRGRIE
jgi:tyrocidine synthetase-3